MISTQTYRAFLLFFYSTGALIGEAHRMLKDVDLKKHRVTIRSDSFGHFRTIPIGFDHYRILAAYIGFRNRQKVPEANQLFVDKNGQPINGGISKSHLWRIRRIAGLSSKDISNPPRMHDLRNAFVFHRLGAWSKAGVDLSGIPALAAYMGLVGLKSTERYLRLTQERFRHQLNLISPRRGRKHWGDDRGLMKFLAQL